MDPREFLRLLLEDTGLNANSLAAATRNRTKQPQIHRYLTGEAKEPKRSTWLPVAQFFGAPVDAFFDPALADQAWADYKARKERGWMPEQHTKEGTGSGGEPPPLAHALSLPRRTMTPVTVAWEQLMSGPLEPEFQVVMPDASMAPDIPKGAKVIFITGVEPEPADRVLCCDSAGNVYLRNYVQVRPGHWEAHAVNKAYLPLDSERDGLRVLALYDGHRIRG